VVANGAGGSLRLLRRRYPLLATHYFPHHGRSEDPRTVPNPAPHRDYVIAHTQHEFTSMCPITGHPDFAVITVKFAPDKTCVELKSLKLYLHAFRNEGIFFEAVTNKICDDIGEALKPRATDGDRGLERPRRDQLARDLRVVGEKAKKR